MALRRGAFLLLLVAAHEGVLAFPHPVQERYRWRKDDGPEATATWIRAPDTPYRKLVVGEQVRLRFTVLNEEGEEDADNYHLRIQYTDTSRTNTFHEVPVVSETAPFVMGQSPHITQGEPATDLLPGNGLFQSGMCVEFPSNSTSAVEIDKDNKYGNYEYCIRTTTNAIGATTYFFRLVQDETSFDELEGRGRYDVIAEAYVVGLPLVDNAGGAKAITTRSARLEGRVIDAKGDDPYVRMYWGRSDGGTDPGAWSNVVNIGVRSRGFSSIVNGLRGNETVFYRCCASNVAGVSWADASTNFTTPGPTVAFTNEPYIVDEGVTSVTVHVALDSPSAETVYVAYATENGSATAGQDYTAVTGVLEWAAGETVARGFGIPIIDDESDEPGEVFRARLLCGTNCAIAQTETTVVIDDNDGLPTLQFSSSASSGHESASTAVIGLSLSPVSGIDVRIRYRVANGTASSGHDYILTPGLATIPAGQSGTNILVSILEDSEYEQNETLVLSILEPENAQVGVTTTHVYTITDTDPRPPTMGNWKGAADISATGAVVRGEVIDTGRSDPWVSVFWGPIDGGTSPNAWSNVIHLGRMGQETFSSSVSMETAGTLYYYRCRGTNVVGAGWSDASENFLATDPPSFLLLDNQSIEAPEPAKPPTTPRSWVGVGDSDIHRVNEFPRSGSYSMIFPSAKGILIYGNRRNSFLATWNGRYWDGQSHPLGGVRPGFVLTGVAHIRAREIGMDPSMFSFAWHNVDESANWMSNQVEISETVYQEILLLNTNPIPPTSAGDRFVPAISRDTVGTTQADYFHADDVTIEVSLPRLNLERDPAIPVAFPETVVGSSTEVSLGVRNLGGGQNTVLYGAYVPTADRLGDPAWDYTGWNEIYDASNSFEIISGAALVATNNGGYEYVTIAFEPSGPGICTGVFRVATTDPNDNYPESGGVLYDHITYERYVLVGRAVEPPALTCPTIGIREGDNGSVRAIFTLSLATQIQANATVHYATSNGTATAGEDYLPVSGSAVIPKGGRTIQVETEILGDLVREKDEAFYLILSDPENATLPDPPYAKCEIRDDESTLILIR